MQAPDNKVIIKKLIVMKFYKMSLSVTKRFCAVIFFCGLAVFSQAQADVVGIENEEKTFGDWKVFCETDVMMETANCKVAAKFYENLAVINIEPQPKFMNKLFIVIPQTRPESVVKIRVSKNDMILSEAVKPKDFGMIKLDDEQKAMLFNQMKNGDFLFLRFNVRNAEQEITVRLSLRDFRSAMNYYNSKISR